MPLHLSEFSREALQGYVENRVPAKNRILEAFMPVKKLTDIKFAFNQMNGAHSKAASITAFNAGAPLRSKAGMERVYGEVAKVQDSFRLDEEDLLRFNRPRPDSDEEAEVIEYIYDQTDDTIEGIKDVEEWMRAQALYHDRMDYSKNGMEIGVDFGVPAGNKLTTTAGEKFNTETGTPLTALRALVTIYKNANRQKAPVALHMSETMLNDIAASPQVKNHVYGSATDARIVTRDQVQALFTSLGLPAFTLQDEMVAIYDDEERLLPERRIVALGSELGNTYLGITSENEYKAGMYVVPEIKVTNPPHQAVFVGETVFPALAKPFAVAWIDA